MNLKNIKFTVLLPILDRKDIVKGFSKALESIYNEIDALERSEVEVKEYNNYTEMYIWLLFPALMLGLFMEIYKRFIFRSMF